MAKKDAADRELVFEGFKGLNNILPPEKKGTEWLDTATNCDIDSSSPPQIRRRNGYVSVYSGSIHSLYTNPLGTVCLFREGTNLKTLNSDYTANTVLSGIVGTNPFSYLTLNDRIYFSDSNITGIYDGGSCRSWGIEPPPKPSLSDTSGELAPGRYLVALTYIGNGGQESGSLGPTEVDVTNGGISVTNIQASTNAGVVSVNIYISTTNGETLYFAGIIANGVTSFNYRGSGVELRYRLDSMFLTPPLGGHILAWFNGRIYVARDSFIYYSEPYKYELFNLAHNFFSLDSRVTLLAPVDDGIWMGTEKEIFFVGMKDPESGFQRLRKASYGAIEGTARALTGEIESDNGAIIGWVLGTDRGVCLAGPGGMFQNFTMKNYSYAKAKYGTSLIRAQSGMKQYVMNLVDATGESYYPYI